MSSLVNVIVELPNTEPFTTTLKLLLSFNVTFVLLADHEPVFTSAILGVNLAVNVMLLPNLTSEFPLIVTPVTDLSRINSLKRSSQ